MSDIPGWKYYNHAAIPTCAPHEMPDLTPIKDGSIWNIDGKKPLMVCYTTDWDCGYDTGWWYLIKEAPFSLETLSSSSRKHIKVALKKNVVKKIDASQYVDALYECSHQAFLKYKQACNEESFEIFKRNCMHAKENCIDYWASFEPASEKMTGFMVVKDYEDWISITTAKFNPRFLKNLPSDALYAFVLDYYLNQKCKKYVSSGSRSINHESNTQEYKEIHFGYRKAYCNLNILYTPKLRIIVKILYPFRKLIGFWGNYVIILHLVSAVLKMECIARMRKSFR